jgi:hypothetical protein
MEYASGTIWGVIPMLSEAAQNYVSRKDAKEQRRKVLGIILKLSYKLL